MSSLEPHEPFLIRILDVTVEQAEDGRWQLVALVTDGETEWRMPAVFTSETAQEAQAAADVLGVPVVDHG